MKNLLETQGTNLRLICLSLAPSPPTYLMTLFISSFSCIIGPCCLLAEKAMAPHSSTLAWKIPWTEEPGGLQSMGSLRVGHD